MLMLILTLKIRYVSCCNYSAVMCLMVFIIISFHWRDTIKWFISDENGPLMLTVCTELGTL